MNTAFEKQSNNQALGEEHMKDNTEELASGLLTRDQMQTEALTIETLLDAVMAVYGSFDHTEMIELVEMAQKRAKRLNTALDSVYVQDDAA